MDKKYNANDEEYQFQDTEPNNRFTTANAANTDNPVIFERIRRQHIVLGFISIFLIFGVYKLLSHFFHAVVAREHVITRMQKQVPKINSVDSELAVRSDMTKRLERLAQEQSSVQSAVQSLDSQIADIQSSLANLNVQLTQVHDEVQSLHASQEVLLQKQKKPKAPEKKATPKPIYYVRAIIPGRVWLTTQEGSTLTLGVGDKLAGYGLIDSINPDQGTITLSSGAIIGYSPDDR